MYLNWSDSFVRPEEDAIVSLLNRLGSAYVTRRRIFFWKCNMCRYRFIEEGKLCGPESLPDAVFLNEVLTDCLSAISRFDMGMHLIDCLFQLSMPHVVPMDHCQHYAQRKMPAADKRQPLPKRWLPLCTSIGPA